MEEHANGKISGRYGKQLLDNDQLRQEGAAKVRLGLALPTDKQQPKIDKSGQVSSVEEQEPVSVQVYMRAGDKMVGQLDLN